MSAPTNYRFNLDAIDGHVINLQEIPYVPMLKCIVLTAQEQVFLRRGMLQKLCSHIRAINRLRMKQKDNRVFMRLSSISAKDVYIDWSDPTEEILKRMISSWRVQEDLDEALVRQAPVSLCVLPWKTFKREYRTFVTPTRVWTRDDTGVLVTDSRFSSWADQLRTALNANDFVFDMGDSDEYGLTFIECNQLDETTDEYLPKSE